MATSVFVEVYSPIGESRPQLKVEYASGLSVETIRLQVEAAVLARYNAKELIERRREMVDGALYLEFLIVH